MPLRKSPYRLIITDFDNSLSEQDGKVLPEAVQAIKDLKARHPEVLVAQLTGRSADCYVKIPGRPPKDQSEMVMPNDIGVFDFIVCDNGGTIVDPKTGKVLELLGPELQPGFVAALEAARDEDEAIWYGVTMVAAFGTSHAKIAKVVDEYKATVDPNLAFEIEDNLHWVMFSATGVNKAKGLRRVMHMYGITPDQVVGIGDGQNDASFLEVVGMPVGVANAVPKLQEIILGHGGVIVPGERGKGFAQVVQAVARDIDLRSLRGIDGLEGDGLAA